MNLSKKLAKFLSFATLILGLILVIVSGSNLRSAFAVPPVMVTICHAAGQVGTLQYITLTLPENAVYGQAGHFNENGTPNAGHENDYLGACNSSTPTNDPTPTGVTPTDVTPTGVTPTGTTVTPTDTQDPTPTSFACPTGQTYDSGQRICIYIDCEGSGTCEVEIGKSPTPTATPTATATATPTPGSNNGGSSTVQSATGSNNGGSSSSPSVPAPAMAPTGVFGSIAGNASLLAGFLLTSLALPGYAKKKKN